MSELVSIVVPVYNTEKYINECINSIINQTYKNLEIIIVNDGSIDASSKIILDWKKKDSRIIVIDKNNTGVSDTRNLGIHHSKGKYIYFCDSDDVLSCSLIEKLVYMMEGYNSKLAISGYTREIDNLGKGDFNIEILEKSDFLIQLIDGNGFLWNKLFLRSIIVNEKIEFDSELSVCEDERFILEYLKYVDKISETVSKLYFYRLNYQSVLLNKRISEKKMTYILAKEKIFNDIINAGYNKEIQTIYFNHLIKVYCYSTKDLLFKKNYRIHKKKWIKHIKKNYMKLKKCSYQITDYTNWNIRLKVYLLILNIICRKDDT